MKSDGRFAVPQKILELAKQDFVAARIDDPKVDCFLPNQVNSDLRVLRRSRLYRAIIRGPSYTVDPHMAVGLAAADIVANTRYLTI